MTADLNNNSSQTADEWLKEKFGMLSSVEDSATKALMMKMLVVASDREDVLDLFTNFDWVPTSDDMCMAAAAETIKTMKWMQKKGVDINALASSGIPPIFESAAKGQIATMERMVELGARLDIKDKNGNTIADFAASNGQTEAAEWLRKQLNLSQQNEISDFPKENNAVSLREKAFALIKESNGNNNSFDEALALLKQAAALGDADAQFEIGTCYFNGHGVSQNINTAVEWFTKAANQDHVMAQYNLGVCYATGSGVPKDTNKSVEWFDRFIKATNQNSSSQTPDEWLKEKFELFNMLDENTKERMLKIAAMDSDREDILDLLSSFGWEPTNEDMSHAAEMGKATTVRWMQKKLNQPKQIENEQNFETTQSADEWLKKNVEICNSIDYDNEAKYLWLKVSAIGSDREDILNLFANVTDWTPTIEDMCQAALVGKIETIKWMQKKGIDINECPKQGDMEGDMPIHCAAIAGEAATVEWLLKNGINVNVRGRNNATPMHKAVYSSDTDAVKRTAVIKVLNDHHANLNVRDDSYMTPLDCAAQRGLTEHIKYLVELGADLKAADEKVGLTCMHHAAVHGQPESIRCLERLGVSVDVKDRYGNTPIFFAAMGGHIECIKCLKELRADVNAKDENGGTPIFSAVFKGKADALECLVRLGGNINATLSNGMTPIFAAAMENQVALMERMVTLGARLDIKNNNGKTVLEFAESNNLTKAAEWLRKKLNQTQPTSNVSDYESPAYVAPKPEISNLEKARQELERERQNLQNRSSYSSAQPADKKSSSPVGAIVTVLILAAAGIGAYFYLQPNVKKLIDSGMAHYEAKNFNDAIAYFTRAIQLEPNNPALYFRRGDAHDANKAYANAIADYTKAIQLDPNDARFWNNRGGTHRVMESYENALIDYTEAIRLNPSDARYRNNRGVVHHLKKDYPAAINDYSSAIQLAPDNARYRNNRGQVHSLMRNHIAAAEDFREAVRIEPTSQQYRENLELAEERAARQRQQQRRR